MSASIKQIDSNGYFFKKKLKEEEGKVHSLADVDGNAYILTSHSLFYLR